MDLIVSSSLDVLSQWSLCKLGESQSTVLDCRCHGCYVCSCQNDEEQLVWRAIGTCEASGAQSQPEVWVMISQYCLNSINFNDSIIFDSFQFLFWEILSAQWVGAFHQHPQTPPGGAREIASTSCCIRKDLDKDLRGLWRAVQGPQHHGVGWRETPWCWWCWFSRLMGFRRWTFVSIEVPKKMGGNCWLR